MRIICFQTGDGRILQGVAHQNGIATVLHGSIESGFVPTTEKAHVHKLLAPILPIDIVCIGRNYDPPKATASSKTEAASDGQREENGGRARSKFSDADLEVFLKPLTALQNPHDPICIPRFDDLDIQLDCEGELAVIIGREMRHVSEADALDYVFGYTIANDITARVFQTPTGPPIWMRGKGFDTFCPLGPVIVTADEIPDPQTLGIRTIINGQTVRDGNTRDMIRTVPQIIAALSRHMTLRAGAVVLTGAPPVKEGVTTTFSTVQAFEIQIDGMGVLHNSVGMSEFSIETG